MRWIIATWTKALLLSTVRSNDLASRRDRLSQPKVRSTIQRFFCNTNLPRGRVTISTHHSHWIYAQLTTDRYAVSAQMIFGNFTDSWNASRVSFAPSRSCTSAGVMTSAQTSPNESTTTCRLRPSTFFSGVVATWPALFGRLDRLAIEHRRRGLGRLARLLANSIAKLRVQSFPGSIRLPLAEPVEHDIERREVVRQRTPCATVTRDVKNRVDDLTLRVLRWTTGRASLGTQGSIRRHCDTVRSVG